MRLPMNELWRALVERLARLGFVNGARTPALESAMWWLAN